MKLKLKYTVIGVSALALCVISLIIINILNNKPNTNSLNKNMFFEADYVELSLDKIISHATHIIDAEYVGTYTSDYGKELKFKPINLIKGEIDKNIDSIYVQSLSINENQETIAYKMNNRYMLFLEKNSSVYYEHDKYVQLSELHITSNDKEWNKYLTEIQTALTRLKNIVPPSYGVEYTSSTTIDNIIDISKNIFAVKIEDIYAESTVAPTTVYRCSVTKTLRNIPVDNGNILITFFNNTVSVGNEYLVLLADATETAPVYTLSSKNSIYNLNEAKAIPELEKLLVNAAEFKTITNIKTDKDILAEEREAAGK